METVKFVKLMTSDNENWCDNAEHLEMFLRATRHYYMEVLTRKHIVTLNEVYEYLDFKKSIEGYMYGWIIEDDSAADIFNYEIHQFENGLLVVITFECSKIFSLISEKD